MENLTIKEATYLMEMMRERIKAMPKTLEPDKFQMDLLYKLDRIVKKELEVKGVYYRNLPYKS